ncbi:MAG: TonB family protein, partial [Pseudomonadota bacterium]|nr:TonB family protein [Pseudomonadota bacterium]
PDTITTTASSEITQKPDAPEPIPSVKSSPTPDSIKPDSQVRTIEQPAANITSSTASEQARFAGDDQRFSDPVEQKYYERLMAHLNQKLPAHPAGIQGDVRLQVTIKYGAVITAVDVIVSSGDSATDEWARRAILATSPVPAVPSDLPQPYLFRPTLRLTD